MAEPAATYEVRAPMIELTLARVRELTREPEAIFWVFVFPILLAAILGLAFRSRPPDALPVAVVSGPHADARVAALSSGPDLKVSVLSEADARLALARGRVVLVVSADETPSYAYDPTQPESRAARLAVDAALQRSAGRVDAFSPGRSEVTEAGSRYVDFLVPGLLGMNLMGTGMWGIGFSLVVARNGNLLKRLIAAPGAAQPSARGAAHLALDFPHPRSGGVAALRLLRARRPAPRLGVPAHRDLAARRPRLQRPGPPHRRPAPHHRRRVGHHEPRDGADVDLLRHLLLDRALPGDDAAVRAGAAV